MKHLLLHVLKFLAFMKFLFNSQNRWILLIFSLNLALSLFFCFVISPQLTENGITLVDPDGYGSAGLWLYENRNFPGVDKPPLYPAWIALVSWISGSYSIEKVQISQCLLLAFSMILLYRIFIRTIPQQAKWASLICAIYPIFIWYTPRLWSETLLLFCIALLTYTFIAWNCHPENSKKFWLAFSCGLICGFTALTKGNMMLFIVLISFFMIRKRTVFSLFNTGVFIIGAFTLILPWIIRNYHITNALIPIHTRGGYNFFLGNGFARHWLQAPFSYSTLKSLTKVEIDQVFFRAGQTPSDSLEADQWLYQAAWQEFKIHPEWILYKIFINSFMFWYLAADPIKSLVTGIAQIPFLLLSLPGIWFGLKQKASSLYLLLPIAGVMLSSIPILSFARLSSVIMPYIIGLAFFSIHNIKTNQRKITKNDRFHPL